MNDPIRRLSKDECALLAQVTRFGSAAYPVRKWGRGWTWGLWRSIQGPPTVFRTKRAAVASFEAFLGVLREARAVESRCRLVLERIARYQGDEEKAARWIRSTIGCSIGAARSMIEESKNFA